MRVSIALLAALCAAFSPGSSASAGAAPGAQRPRAATAPPREHDQSSNWFGYNQGSLEQGGTLFNSITGDWTVPTATQHTAGQDEYSSDWIGIGGGCVDAGCTVGDNTLIQTGTEQDVTAAGQAVVLGLVGARPRPVDLRSR